MVQSESERVRGSSHCLRESEGQFRDWGSQSVQSVSEGIRGSSQGLRESEGPVRV